MVLKKPEAVCSFEQKRSAVTKISGETTAACQLPAVFYRRWHGRSTFNTDLYNGTEGTAQS